jgi:hypothetical protein
MSDADGKIITCSNPACRVSETGKCVEGLELAACQNYGKAAVVPEKIESDIAEEKSRTNTVTLSSAAKLTILEATRILRQRQCKVIAVIGPHDAGKTSLIASMFDLFQEGPVGGVEFASSKTLQAFELACHDARCTSKRAIPHSERTKHTEGLKFYHLYVRRAAAKDGMTLILGDRAGETYREATDNVDDAYEFCEVNRADTITILIDGERLLDIAKRHEVRSDIEHIVQALVEAKVVLHIPKVALVLTKIDAVKNSPQAGRVESDFDSILASLRNRFSSNFTCVEPFKVAASPKFNNVTRGCGISELLNFWLTTPENPQPIHNQHSVATRMIGRLTVLKD